MARDTGVANSLDISGSVAGPGTAPVGTPTGVPAASPLALVLLSIGLAAVGGWQVKRRMFDRLMHEE